jgi:large subunit ribosomal protein L4
LESPTARKTHDQSPLSLNAFEQPVVATLYQFPSLEPTGYALYHPQFLNVPLRRDILHRAVIFEADGSRQGTASTKWRADVHGSNRKILQQKGTGKARAGDKKSPIRRGGGVAFGPHPRDFSTELQAKVYAQAFRTALSYRYRKGELVILDNDISGLVDETDRWLHNVFVGNNWTRGNGTTLVVTDLLEESNPEVFRKMRLVDRHATVKDTNDVDVKDLLEKRRIVIEKGALQTLLSPSITGLPPGATKNMVRYVEKTL